VICGGVADLCACFSDNLGQEACCAIAEALVRVSFFIKLLANVEVASESTDEHVEVVA
jgi:hypothetical protein